MLKIIPKPNLPSIKGYTWRDIRPADGPSLQKFEQTCAIIDGATYLKGLDAWETLSNEPGISIRSLVAINIQDEISVAGWFLVDERIETVLAFLDGRVHPDFRGRGYGTALLGWLETQARRCMEDIADGRPCSYRIMFYDRAPDAPTLFETKGYALQYIEQEMQRTLKQSLPQVSDQQELTFEPWTPDNKPDFYRVYRAAFSTRTDNLMSADAWHHHFANPNSPDYQPSSSLLARKSGQPVAYVVIHIEETAPDSKPTLAWITQTGVHADYRQHGIGTALLTETMRRLDKAGYESVKLSVNENNPQAASLYQHLGFTRVNRFTMYHRMLISNH